MENALAAGCGPAMLTGMSTVELLEHVKALPSRERRRFVESVLALETAGLARKPAKSRRVKWPDVQARSQRIFGRRLLPNLVLLERADEAH